MDLSKFGFNKSTKTIDILTQWNLETIVAIKQLITDDYINPNDFKIAHFTCHDYKNAKIEFVGSSQGHYEHVIIHSINLNDIALNPITSKSEYGDYRCALQLLKIFHLDVLESLESFFINTENYVFNGTYDVLVDKSGFLR